jgi:hypothetical protein
MCVRENIPAGRKSSQGHTTVAQWFLAPVVQECQGDYFLGHKQQLRTCQNTHDSTT